MRQTTAASSPVGVGPAYPTSEGKSDGFAFVGREGGKLWLWVEPAHSGAKIWGEFDSERFIEQI